jgi:hypothetical protein
LTVLDINSGLPPLLSMCVFVLDYYKIFIKINYKINMKRKLVLLSSLLLSLLPQLRAVDASDTVKKPNIVFL